jgi:hypothetical protein
MIQDQLREALGAFMEAGKTREAGKISAALARITELQQQLGADTPPMLRHYLERRSYQKALDFLTAGRPETDKPQCGH